MDAYTLTAVVLVCSLQLMAPTWHEGSLLTVAHALETLPVMQQPLQHNAHSPSTTSFRCRPLHGTMERRLGLNFE